ncbi:MAG: DUF1598 domain-containing protein [Planctomycetes bacterium]|nr:DUF1598 domain-containing protein [Planctomycetota bacterium]
MRRTTRPWMVLAVIVLEFVGAGSAFAQFGGGFGGGGGGFGGGGGGFGGGRGRNNRSQAGVRIDATGVVSLAVSNDASGLLDKKRREALAEKALFPDVNIPSQQRHVSLVELEKVIGPFLDKGLPIPDEAFFLAGLQRIDHIFVLPETGDLVIAGPAEGFAPDAAGRMRGVSNGKPVLRLDDLVVALRSVSRTELVGCSIDPVPQRLAALQQFLAQGGPATADVVKARFEQMDDILGLQTVRVDGIRPDSHFAVNLVEADYRMKRISMGLEHHGVKGLKSHLAMLAPGGNSMQRWWFVPFYEGIFRSDDGLAFHLSGQRAQLLAEEELADANGNRSAAATTRLSTRAFAKQFTDKFPQLAEKSPIFAELQNLIDWTVLAALIEKENLAGKVNWKMATFLDEQRMSIPTFNAPKQIPSSMNYKSSGSLMVGLVGGGVCIRPEQVLKEMTVPASGGMRLESIRALVTEAKRPEIHHWWWDNAVE